MLWGGCCEECRLARLKYRASSLELVDHRMEDVRWPGAKESVCLIVPRSEPSYVVSVRVKDGDSHKWTFVDREMLD